MSRLVTGLGERVARLGRRPVLRRLIVAAIPAAVRVLFDPGSATDLETTFELRVRDPRGREPARFTIFVRDCHCQVSPGAAADAVAAVTAGADDLVLLAFGAVGWPELLSGGRMELTGNPFLALRFPVLFRLPASPATVAGATPRPSTPRPSTPRPARTRRWARAPRTRRSSRSAATS
jgi:hypothetical protein